MKKLILAMQLSLAATAAHAQDIPAGARVTVKSDAHASNGRLKSLVTFLCGSDSGLCLRDIKTTESKPLTQTGSGFQAVFGTAGVVYLLQADGKGSVYNFSGRKIGEIVWSQ